MLDAQLRRRPFAVVAVVLLAGAVSAVAAQAAALPRAGHHQARRAPGPWCGGALWRQMAFSDADRRKVTVAPLPTTISDIAELPRPRRIRASRATGFQRRVWHLTAVIDRYRVASNGEIVLILFSIYTGHYMNAYMPNPSCLSGRTRQRPGILAARRTFVGNCPAVTPAWQLLGATVEINGVGFWNPSTLTRGALPNGAELRPVTGLSIDSGCGMPR